MDLKPHEGLLRRKKTPWEECGGSEASDISVGTDTERAPTTGTAFRQDSLTVSIET